MKSSFFDLINVSFVFMFQFQFPWIQRRISRPLPIATPWHCSGNKNSFLYGAVLPIVLHLTATIPAMFQWSHHHNSFFSYLWEDTMKCFMLTFSNSCQRPSFAEVFQQQSHLTFVLHIVQEFIMKLAHKFPFKKLLQSERFWKESPLLLLYGGLHLPWESCLPP